MHNSQTKAEVDVFQDGKAASFAVGGSSLAWTKSARHRLFCEAKLGALAKFGGHFVGDLLPPERGQINLKQGGFEARAE